jgi:hypothetical protein
VVCAASAALVVLMTVLGSAGLVLYSGRPVLAALGFVSKQKYLEENSQDYETVEAVNRLVGKQETHLRTLLFVRHLYYLDIPYLNGDPGTSFALDADHLQTAQEWKAFFFEKRIGYVVRSPQYPQVIAAPLEEMKKNGDLVPKRRYRTSRACASSGEW